jgi:putative ATPase
MENETLFTSDPNQVPLAEKQRPDTFTGLVGQSHILTDRFRSVLETDRWTGFIFWGPPGTGKTSLAKIIAGMTNRKFHLLSGVTSGVKEIKEVLERSKGEFRMGRPSHILFLDEVHRLNKSQQDVLLPYLEEGSIRFIGATTENPSFEVNNALVSRSLVFQFKALSQSDLMILLKRSAPEGLVISESIFEKISELAGGDARRALNLLDHLCLSRKNGEELTLEDVDNLCSAQTLYYDKHGDAHHDSVSAFIKSIRGSDPDAAVYYLARMIEAGEDPLFIARRLIILASEDVGNANPAALMVATSAFQAVHSIGMPEGRIVLAQATTYLACSEKSNRSYVAINLAQDEVKKTGSLEIPEAIRYQGRGYQYPHNSVGSWISVTYLPEKLKRKRFYQPTPNGNEKKFVEFLKFRGKD